MEEHKLIAMDLADTIIDRPHGFSVGSRHFYLYPVTIGKMHLLSRLTEDLELNIEAVEANPYLEALRIAEEKKSQCCLIITYHTMRTKAKIFDNEFVEKRKSFFEKELSREDIARLMVYALTWDRTSLYMKHLRLDKEIDRMKEVTSVKSNKNSYTFGGVSLYGSLIDTACERYGWTYDYVVWEISYINLRLMLADSQKQIYLTDEEAKRVKVPNSCQTIKASDKEKAWAFIKSQNWD